MAVRARSALVYTLRMTTMEAVLAAARELSAEERQVLPGILLDEDDQDWLTIQPELDEISRRWDSGALEPSPATSVHARMRERIGSRSSC